MSSLVKIGNTQIRVTGRLLRIARLEADGYLFLENPESFLAELRRSKTRVDVFHFMPRLAQSLPKYDYPVEMDNVAALPVSTFDEWWNNQIGFKARNKAKQAEKKGVTVREVPFDDNLVRGIKEVYDESPVRQGAPNKHYGKPFETLYREEATFLDTSIFIGAFLGESLIGFIKLVHDETKSQAGLMNIVSMVQHRDKAPTNALVAQAVRSCADRGIQHLVYSRFVYGKKQESSLIDFKERNGFQKIDLPRYYVPITKVGAVAVRHGLYKKLSEHVPEPVLAKLRELRSSFYGWKFKASPKTATPESADQAAK